jgi:guanylate kinase
MNNKRGNLFILSAPSGAGKSSLISALLERHDDMKVSISHTTRDKRPGEEDTVHYHFINVEQFKQYISEGVFVEWAEVFGNYYGTSKIAIAQMLDSGIDVFLDIDWQGAQQIREQFEQVITVFILPPSQHELKQRLCNRGQDSEEIIGQRMAEARAEMIHYHEFDYLLVNDQFESSLIELQRIVLGARLKMANQTSKFDHLLKDLLDND